MPKAPKRIAINCGPRLPRPWPSFSAASLSSNWSCTTATEPSTTNAMPVNTARPPASGIGVWWILRWPGSSTRPVRSHHARQSGSEAAVATSAPKKASR